LSAALRKQEISHSHLMKGIARATQFDRIRAPARTIFRVFVARLTRGGMPSQSTGCRAQSRNMEDHTYVIVWC
jgi:hypothetical protein